MVAVVIDKQRHRSAKRSFPRPVWKYAEENRPERNWLADDYDHPVWKFGEAACGE